MVNTGFGQLLKVPGVNWIFCGLQDEEPKVYLIVAWDAVESHYKFREDKVTRPALLDVLEQATSDMSSLTNLHANFVDDPSPVFSAPVTEFVVVTPKAGVSTDDIKVTLDRLLGLFNDPAGPALGGRYAPIVEKDGSYLLIGGWKTVQDHWDAVKSGPAAEVVGELRSKADIVVTHAALKAYSQ